jgi:hypothetical protein
VEVAFEGRYPSLYYQSASPCGLSVKSPSRFVKLQGTRISGRLEGGAAVLELLATD